MRKQKKHPAAGGPSGLLKKEKAVASKSSIPHPVSKCKAIQNAIANFTHEAGDMDTGYLTLRCRFEAGTLIAYEVTPHRKYEGGSL